MPKVPAILLYLLINVILLSHCADILLDDISEHLQKYDTDFKMSQITSAKSYYDDYILIKPEISKHKLSVVYKAHARDNPNLIVAIKKTKIDGVNKKFRGRAIREARLLMFLRHERIIRAFGVYDKSNHVVIAMEWMQYGTLERFTVTHSARKVMPEAVAIGVMRQIAQAVEYLHHYNIVHRDIKPANVMFGEGTKLIDLGFCTKLRTSSKEHRNLCGSNMFIPLDVHVKRVIMKPTDIYALGLTIILLFKDPMPGVDKLGYTGFLDKLKEENGPWGLEEIFTSVPAFESLLRMCVLYDSTSRPSATSLLHDLLSLEGATDEQVFSFVSQNL